MKVQWKKAIVYVCASVFCIAMLSSISTYTVEAVETAANRGFNVPVTWNEGDAKVTLPEAPKGWDIELFGSDRKEVVALDGSVTRPLEDVEVKLLYKLTNNTSKEVLETNVNTSIAIKKKLPASFVVGTNQKPEVLPALREWIGGTGKVDIKNGTRIIVDSENYRQEDAIHKKANIDVNDNFYRQVITFKLDLLDLTGVDAPIVVDGTPGDGDIYFTAKQAPTTLGKEGYQIEIGEVGTNLKTVTVRASQRTGVLYGGVSILQILKQTNGELPVGVTRDYPEFENRGYMLDVARTFLPLEYLNDTMKQMTWYKLNTFAVHLSDNDIWENLTLGEEVYAAFRLESDVEGLTAKDGYYTKDEFRELQYDGNDLGIAVIPELDTPGHALAYTRVWPDISRGDGGKYLDVEKPETLNRIAKLFDEYTIAQEGIEEVFVMPLVNIGTDEYKNGNKEAFRSYTDALLKHIKASGKEPVFWGSLTENSGTTPVMTDATMFAWYHGYANAKDSLEAGYNIISMEDQEVYIVPGGGYYGNQYGRAEYIYNSWIPNNNSGWRGSPAPEGHPRVSGGQFAVWNDWVGNGISTGDINFRIQYNMQSIAQKTWTGEKSSSDYATFKALGESLGDAPNADFLFSDEQYDNNEVVNISSVEDIDSNAGASLKAQNITTDTGRFEEGIRFNGGSSYISTDLESTGFDWTMAMWIHPESENSEDSVLMEGKTGTLKLKQGKTNKLGYSVDRLFDEDGKPTKDKYNHYFDYEILSNKWTHVTLSGDAYGVKLYINGIFVEELKDKPWPNYNVNSGQNSISGKPNYYQTLMLPTAIIGSKTNAFKGILDDLQVYNRVLSASEVGTLPKIPGIEVPNNLALNANVTGSGNEVDKWNFTKVTDGVRSGDSRWSSNYDDNAWLQIDLGSIQNISQIDVYWEAAFAIKYKMLISTDGNIWVEVLNETNGNGGFPKRINFEVQQARYVKFQGIERKVIGGGKWGYSMYEIEVFAPMSLKRELIKLHTEMSILYEATSVYLDEAASTLYKNTLSVVDTAILQNLMEEEIAEHLASLATLQASLNEIKSSKEAMKVAREVLDEYIAKYENNLSIETKDNANALSQSVDQNLAIKADLDTTKALTSSLSNLLQVAKDEVTFNNISYGSTVTTGGELWNGFPVNNLVDGKLDTRLAYKRTANNITIDIALSNMQKVKPWNQLILREVVGMIEDNEVVGSEIVAYDLQIKLADGSYESIQKVERLADNPTVNGPYLSIELDKKITTDAIRLILTPKSANAGLNISELELYNTSKPVSSDTDIRGIVHNLEIPTITGAGQMALPTLPNGFKVRVVQSSQPTSITHTGVVALSDSEQEVIVVMEVSKMSGANVVERATYPYTVKVPPKATVAEIEAFKTYITEAKGYESVNYSINSWASLQGAITSAEKSLTDSNLMESTIVIEREAIATALKNLVNLSELQKRVKDFELLDEGDYVSESYQAAKAVVLEKQVLLTKADVTSQEIIAACKVLDELVIEFKSDPAELIALIEQYKNDPALVDTDFTHTSWLTFKTVLEEAVTLLDAGSYSTEILSAVHSNLVKAHSDLVSVVSAKQVLTDYENKDLSSYTANSKNAYIASINTLTKTIEKVDASKEEITIAITNTLLATENLVKKADGQKLQEALNAAQAYINDKALYTEKTYNNFYQAYSLVNAMKNDENVSNENAENAIKILAEATNALRKMIILEESNVVIETDEDAIPLGTKLTIQTVSDEDRFVINETLSSIGKKVQLFDLVLTFEGKPVTLQKNVKVRLLIPEGYDNSRLALFYVNGTHKEELAFVIVDDYVEFFANHFSIYAIVEKDVPIVPSEPSNPSNPATPDTDSPSTTKPSTTITNPDKSGSIVNTGEDSVVNFYFICLLGAAGTLLLMNINKKNDKNYKKL